MLCLYLLRIRGLGSEMAEIKKYKLRLAQHLPTALRFLKDYNFRP